MARSFWPDQKASVILLPSGPQGDAILDLAREWTRMGLLSPALWVQPEQVHRARSGPPRITATVLVLDREHRLGEVELDLFESLARESLRLVRLVKLRSAVPSREIDAEQDQIAEHVGEYLTKAMPMAVPTVSISDQVTDLTRLTLICAPTEFQLQQRVDWAGSEYGTVVVASPEDRATPWSGDAFVRDNQRFVGFALMHLASVAGLWSGTGVGSFELIPREASSHQSVWVSRVFLNAVITEALGRRTAAQVLDLASQADSLLIDPSAGSPPTGTAFIEDEMVPAYVAQMVEASMSLDRGALSFQATPPEVAPGKYRLGIGEQIGIFARFSGDKLAVMPRWSWRWITSRAARSLTRQLQSAEGTHVVGADYDAILDARDSQLIMRRDAIFAAEREAAAAMAAPVGQSAVRTTPRLWARLRELVFGSLDGSSDLSELGFEPIEEKVPVFGRVSDVFPAPDEPWTTDYAPAGVTLPVDWHSLSQGDPREKILTWVERGKASAEQLHAVSQVSEQAFDMLIEPPDEPERPKKRAEVRRVAAGAQADSVLAPASAAETSVGGEAGTEAASEPETAPETASETAPETASEIAEGSAEAAADAPRPKAKTMRTSRTLRRQWEDALTRRDADRERAATADADVIRREDTLQDYDDWAVSRDRSYAWQMLTRLNHDRTQAKNTVEHFAHEIARITIPAAGELISLRKKFHIRMLLSWGIIVAVAFLLIMFPIWNPDLRPAFADFGLWYPDDVTTVLYGLGLALLLSLIWLAAYHRGWSTFQRKVDVAHAHLNYISEASRNARRELARLKSLHQQTVDWLDLLARAIHHPWKIRPEWNSRPDYEVARESLPFAMNVGTVVENDYAASTRLRRMTTERLVRRGWRADAFRDLIREVAEELGQGNETFGVGALDEDLPHSSNNTRKMLRDTMQREEVLNRVAAPRLRELMGEIQRHALHGSKPRVASIDENPLDALAVMSDPAALEQEIAWDEFLVDSLADRREPVTPLSTSWISQRQIQEGYHERVTSYLVLPQRLEAQLSFHADAAVVTRPFNGAGRSTIDLVWRVDVVGPLPIAAIGLWDAPRQPVVVEVDPASYDSGI